MAANGSDAALAAVWRSNDVAAWQSALRRYWQHGPVQRNLRVECHVDQLTPTDRAAIVASGRALVEFLHDWYYSWKFFAIAPASIPKYQAKVHAEYVENPEKYNRLADRLRQLDPEKIEESLRGLVSAAIPGLRLSAGSGVLAVLYPQWFGTVDSHTLAALRTVDDDRAQWLRQNIRDPKNFFNRHHDEEGLHAATLMIRLYRDKAQQLALLDPGTGWTPRRVEMVCYLLRPPARNRS